MNGTHSASGSRDPHSPDRLDPDADILLDLAHGKPAALGVLMARHLKAVKSTAHYMLGDEMMAEDIAQEVFIKAWKNAPKWQAGPAKFSTWLHRVTRNLCYDRLRKIKEIYPKTVPDMVSDSPEASQLMQMRQNHSAQKSKIEYALVKLPKRQRMAIILCHYQDMSQVEAAAIMEVGVRAYESLLARARKNLKMQLQSHKSELLEN